MSARRNHTPHNKVRQARGRNAALHAQSHRSVPPKSRRVTARRDAKEPFSPPETWHEPTGKSADYRVLIDEPGPGYRHVLTPKQIRCRLSQTPPGFLRDLEVVHLSRMTRKKQSFPCYGMQWGATLYLYPIEESLTEHFTAPPKPDFYHEVKMYGGRWRDLGGGDWQLSWSEQAIEDFYLNNILMHELGHLLDDRNTSYVDRERYAEWFAIEYGYRWTGGAATRRPKRKIHRRHHAS